MKKLLIICLFLSSSASSGLIGGQIPSSISDGEVTTAKLSSDFIVYSSNCMAATTGVAVGQLCIEASNSTDPIWVSTIASTADGFTPFILVANKPFGHVHISTDNAVETPIASNFVFVKVAGTCEVHGNNNFTESAECTLRYDGAVEKKFVIEIVFSVSKAMGNATLGYFRIAKNGDPDTALSFAMQSIRSLANTSDIGNVTVRAVFIAVQNDTFDLWMATANSNNLTIETMSMTVQAE